MLLLHVCTSKVLCRRLYRVFVGVVWLKSLWINTILRRSKFVDTRLEELVLLFAFRFIEL